MQRRPYNKRNKPATLRCPNYRCDNISSKLYIVEDKLIEVLQIWLSNYKIEYEKDNFEGDNILLIKTSIATTEKDLKIETSKLNKVYDFLESSVYTQEDFFERSEKIKENIRNLQNRISEYKIELQKNIDAQQQKEKIIPNLENVVELYNKLVNAEDKNTLLKSVISKVTYLKTEKAIKKDSDPTNFELHIYPKIPKI